MQEKIKFYKCPICGNVVEVVEGDINHITCCGKKMEELVANSFDASVEKHVPIYEQDNDEIIVKIGKTEHPMENVHYIMWIAQVTENRVVRVKLSPEEKPEAKFRYIKGSTIYAYCNKHDLWKKEVK
ncbi:MAG: desulfoferrodoxin family protein [bacterium]|nr:desulfoferrodoxin family protein [bacterium]